MASECKLRPEGVRLRCTEWWVTIRNWTSENPVLTSSQNKRMTIPSGPCTWFQDSDHFHGLLCFTKKPGSRGDKLPEFLDQVLYPSNLGTDIALLSFAYSYFSFTITIHPELWLYEFHSQDYICSKHNFNLKAWQTKPICQKEPKAQPNVSINHSNKHILIYPGLKITNQVFCQNSTNLINGHSEMFYARKVRSVPQPESGASIRWGSFSFSLCDERCMHSWKCIRDMQQYIIYLLHSIYLYMLQLCFW